MAKDGCDGRVSPTRRAVSRINALDAVPRRNSAAFVDKPLERLSEAERKQTYYALLDACLPRIIAITGEFREKFPFGLVRYVDGVGEADTRLISALDADFLGKIERATVAGKFLTCSYWTHDIIARAIVIATELWARDADWDSGELQILQQLVDPHRQKLFGGKAAQKRIASAMVQTLHISASLERFAYLFFTEHHARTPTAQEAGVLHENAMRTAVHLTDLHLERTREIRPLVGAEMEEGGIIHRYVDSSFFQLVDGRLELKPGISAEAMASRPIDTSDGRIGCPGAEFIPGIWTWIREVSAVYAYPALAIAAH